MFLRYALQYDIPITCNVKATVYEEKLELGKNLQRLQILIEWAQDIIGHFPYHLDVSS